MWTSKAATDLKKNRTCSVIWKLTSSIWSRLQLHMQFWLNLWVGWALNNWLPPFLLQNSGKEMKGCSRCHPRLEQSLQTYLSQALTAKKSINKVDYRAETRLCDSKSLLLWWTFHQRRGREGLMVNSFVPALGLALVSCFFLERSRLPAFIGDGILLLVTAVKWL